MACSKKPVVACHWADGKGMAWFCLRHFKAWVKEDDREVVGVWFLENGEAPENIKKNPSGTVKIRKLGENISRKEIFARLEKLIMRAAPKTERINARIGQRYGRYKKLSDAYKEALGLGWLPDPDNEGVFVGYVTVETDEGFVQYEQRLMAQELMGEWFLRVIDESDLISRGGPGSGHHGHRGRLGETGGSEPGKGAPHYRPGAGRRLGAPQAGGGQRPAAGTAQAGIKDVAPDDSATVAQYSNVQAQQSEPDLTTMMETLAELSEGRLEGLENVIKTTESLQAKIERDMLEKGISAQEAASEINDRNRYTLVLTVDDFVAKVERIQAELENQGWTQYDHKYKNFFGGGDTYDGYNTVVVHESGQRFELQFHTEESITIKNQVHEMYKSFQQTSDQSERLAIWRQMADAYAGVARPENWEDLQGRQVYQEEPK